MHNSYMELLAVIARKFMDLGVDIYRMYERDLIDPYKVIDRFDTAEEIKNWMTNIVMGKVIGITPLEYREMK